jgi:hypothetical protein
VRYPLICAFYTYLHSLSCWVEMVKISNVPFTYSGLQRR